MTAFGYVRKSVMADDSTTLSPQHPTLDLAEVRYSQHVIALAVLVVIFVVTGGVLFAAFGAVTGAKLVLSGPEDMAGVLSLAVLITYGVAGALFWWVVGRVIGRPPRDWFRSGYPVTSLRRDDLRTARWLGLLGAILRDTADQRRAEIARRSGHDPGPQFPSLMADQVEEIRRLYAAGEYAEANSQQKALANWVARMGRGSDAEDFYSPAEVVRIRANSDEIMAVWKQLWTVAGDIKASEDVLRQVEASRSTLSRAEPGGS